jgi:hypothetical protein
MMKKAALLVFLLAFSVSMASAETVEQAGQNTGSFWSREAKRSGLSGDGSSTCSMGNFLDKINPINFFKKQQDAYNARKASGAK